MHNVRALERLLFTGLLQISATALLWRTNHYYHRTSCMPGTWYEVVGELQRLQVRNDDRYDTSAPTASSQYAYAVGRMLYAATTYGKFRFFRFRTPGAQKQLPLYAFAMGHDVRGWHCCVSVRGSVFQYAVLLLSSSPRHCCVPARRTVFQYAVLLCSSYYTLLLCCSTRYCFPVHTCVTAVYSTRYCCAPIRASVFY